MQQSKLITASFLFIYFIQCTQHISGELFTLTAAGIGLGLGVLMFPNTVTDIKNELGIFGGESCSKRFINPNWDVLLHDLKLNVHGQELAISHVFGALKHHFLNDRNSKALVLSFHGLPGTGKNYVSEFIVSAIYKFGYQSRFVHKFNSKIHFPNDKLVENYKSELKSWIIGNITNCERSVFIFDEVEKCPVGLLDVIKPFLDHHSTFRNSFGNPISFRNAIFMFLSNIGGSAIADRFLELRQDGYILSGKSRHLLSIHDFEGIIKAVAYGESGGFKMSDIIGTNIIDHYIPFLPLEEKHIIKCIENEYNKHNKKEINFENLKAYVMDSMTFIPPKNIFSSTGCKRIGSKVGTFVEKHVVYSTPVKVL